MIHWQAKEMPCEMSCVEPTKFEDINGAHCLIVAAAHNEFKALRLDAVKKCSELATTEKRLLSMLKKSIKI